MIKFYYLYLHFIFILDTASQNAMKVRELEPFKERAEALTRHVAQVNLNNNFINNLINIL